MKSIFLIEFPENERERESKGASNHVLECSVGGRQCLLLLQIFVSGKISHGKNYLLASIFF